MQGAYIQWGKGFGGDCSVAVLCRRIDARKQIGNTQLLHRQSVRSGAYYYRQLHPDILLEMDDLDKLTLKEYDDLCGIKRKYISTRKMAHIRQMAKERQRVKIATFHQEMN